MERLQRLLNFYVSWVILCKQMIQQEPQSKLQTIRKSQSQEIDKKINQYVWEVFQRNHSVRILVKLIIIKFIYMNLQTEKLQPNQRIVLKSGSSYRIPKQLKKKFEKSPKWVLVMGEYNRLNCQQLFQHAEEVRVQRMWIGFNSNPNILQQISNTSFTNLIELWLTKNRIQSIEILSRINFPLLQEIHIRQNKITLAKSLRRCNWPNIQLINIYGNKIKELYFISELNAQKLTTFWTQYDNFLNPQSETLSWMAKLMSSCLHSICISDNKRIKQSKVMESLKKKSQVELNGNKNQLVFHLQQS